MALDPNPHEERILEGLTGRSVPAEDHLLACVACRSERDRLAKSISAFAASAREATDRPGHFWTRQAAQIHSSVAAAPAGRMGLSSRMASALAVLGLFALLLLQGAPGPRPVVESTPPNSDHELLLEVERALQRETPAALEPVTLLVEDMTGTTSSNSPGIASPRFSKEQPHHDN